MDKLFKTHACATCQNKLCVEKIDLFSNLNREEYLELVQLVTHQQYAPGERIFDIGDSFNSLYVINKGKIKIHDFDLEGNEKIYYILEETDVLGEISLLKQTNFSFMGTAVEPTNVCMIKKEAFDRFIRTKQDVSFKIFEYAFQKITSLEERIKILMSAEAINKVAGHLLKLKREQDNLRVEFSQTQEEMARSIGMSRETFGRKLRELRKKGIISMHKKTVQINDLGELAALSPFHLY